MLLQHGADINSQDEAGFSALHHLSWESHVSATQLLLDQGADVNLRTTDGLSALDMAQLRIQQSRQPRVQRDCESIVQLFLDRGATVRLEPLTNKGYQSLKRLWIIRGRTIWIRRWWSSRAHTQTNSEANKFAD